MAASVLREGWQRKPAGILAAAAALAAMTAVLAPLRGGEETFDAALLYLLVTLIAALVWGYAVGIATAVAADLLINFFFIEPLHTFTVDRGASVVDLAVFLVVALVGATMLSLLRSQFATARTGRQQLAVILDVSRSMAAATTSTLALDALCRSVVETFETQGCAVLIREDGQWSVAATTAASVEVSRDEAANAEEASNHGLLRVRDSARKATETYLPFRTSAGEGGVLKIRGLPPSADERLLAAFAHETALAVGRLRLEAAVRRGELSARADEMKSALLSSVSHDLRSPLTAIKAAVGSLRTDGIDWTEDDRGQFLETIESQADRLTTTVNELLDMSRLETGSVRPNLGPVEVEALVHEAVLSAGQATAGREVDVCVDGKPWARGDFALLSQALVNLIENAGKHSTEGHPIHVRASSGRGQVAIEVADEGPGIDPVDLPHVFEKFYRGKSRGRTPGSGLGLAIVRALVEISGGRVSVESNPDGTVFRISLPPTVPAR